MVVRGTPSTATDWVLVDVDGSEFPLHRSNVLGRRPSEARASEGAQTISLSDAGRVLSRTHALLEVDNEGLWITDLSSTNGTRVLRNIEEDDEQGIECDADRRTLLAEGAALSLGGRKLSFKRSV